jgi:hypothetical protein
VNEVIRCGVLSTDPSRYAGALVGSGFTELSTPKIVASATESGANLFALDKVVPLFRF